MKIDLNADLGEGFGAWAMAEDAAMFDIVTSANIACGGHAGDPDTMATATRVAREKGVVIGAHPGYADLSGFGRRVIPMTPDQIAAMVAVQIGALKGAAGLTQGQVRYVKPHGALANLAAADREVAGAILGAVRAIDTALPILAISGTVLDRLSREAGHPTFSEVFADRAYQADGQLVPRGTPGAVLHDTDEIVARMLSMLESGEMPVLGGGRIRLAADSICLHGDTPGALDTAGVLRRALEGAGVSVAPFVAVEG
ncbi:LamB/YcsF family protein [Maritimibacter sp. DP1N21-5]|uniref:LamB/YcsF family protein n=1 Tax=Maritimibacter sp. DP1N21-5 TaxID=2836867 RepID=UPI001C440D62|nr:5-oxoprolinase subunit PxpA [Maritimibacter sp. DP1N21-5]MBV7407428.1 LamB/YcsF family protein [Maritimibacter sp. DP1N21-5]